MKNTEIGNKTASMNIDNNILSTMLGLIVMDQKQQKAYKGRYYLASHWHLGGVMVGNITFLLFFCFLIHCR